MNVKLSWIVLKLFQWINAHVGIGGKLSPYLCVHVGLVMGYFGDKTSMYMRMCNIESGETDLHLCLMLRVVGRWLRNLK